jgi:aminoglycoside phosphotransferase (APT) family kinase protein
MNNKLFLEKNIPDLCIQSIVQKQGDEHCVIEVNNTWIFRFAKNSDVQQHMGIEVQLLKMLENKIACSIPKVAYYFPDAYCFGYKKILGVPLAATMYEELTEIQKKQFADDFAQFLYELHSSITLDAAEKIGLTRADWPLKPDILQSRLSKVLTDKHLQELFVHFINEYQRIIDADKKLELVHNDLHADNILIDPATKKLSGSIDFTSAAIDTVYHEFRYLHLIDMELIPLAIQAYNQKSGENLAVGNAYIYCMATEFSRLTEALEKEDFPKTAGIKDRIGKLGAFISTF